MRRTLVEHLFRRELREYKLNPQKEIFLVDTKSLELKVAQTLLKEIFHSRARITLIAMTTRKRTNVFLPSSLENELIMEIRAFLEGKKYAPKFLRLMNSVPESEIVAYAKSRHFSGKLLAPHDDVRLLLDHLQEGQPQTKAALRKSFAHLRVVPAKKAKRL